MDRTSHGTSGYSRLSVVTGWLLALLYFVHSCVTIVKARTDRTLPLREELRSWHYIIGLTLFVLVTVRLWRWLKERDVPPAPGVSPGVHFAARAMALTTYLMIFISPIIGVPFGWADNMKLDFGLFVLPDLMERNRFWWQFGGYFHSGMGFMIMVLNIGTLLIAGYATLRYGRGLIKAFPSGFGALVLLAMAATVYANATFQSPDPGPAAVATFLGIVAVVGLAGWFIHRSRRARVTVLGDPPSPWLKAAAIAAPLLMVGIGTYGPHAYFKVLPWPMGVKADGPADIVWHPEPVMRVTAVLPESDFEKQVRAETFKWCVFCHTMKKGDTAFKVGPNLYGIFGQPAASVPNFYYSKALAQMSRDGLVWDDALIAAYSSDPQSFAPGNRMIISSGLIEDPDVLDAIVNILKKETMDGYIDYVDSEGKPVRADGTRIAPALDDLPIEVIP